MTFSNDKIAALRSERDRLLRSYESGREKLLRLSTRMKKLDETLRWEDAFGPLRTKMRAYYPLSEDKIHRLVPILLQGKKPSITREATAFINAVYEGKGAIMYHRASLPKRVHEIARYFGFDLELRKAIRHKPQHRSEESQV